MEEPQPQWLRENKRSNPASEGELLGMELALGHLVSGRRARVLGRFHTCVHGVLAPISEFHLQDQQFVGLSFVGAVSTLYGPEGLHAQGLWYEHDQFEWFWVILKDVQAIELRADPRFRGGTPCLWLTTSIAEYALATAHPTFTNEWENVLDWFNAPRCDIWPREGTRPDWWPAQYSGHWPGESHPGESPSIVPAEEQLRQLTELLSMQPGTSNMPWRRLGPKGDHRYPGQPLHHLGQLLEWDLAYNAGVKVGRDRVGTDWQTEETQGATEKGKAQKRRQVGINGRRTKLKRGANRQPPNVGS